MVSVTLTFDGEDVVVTCTGMDEVTDDLSTWNNEQLAALAALKSIFKENE